MATELSRLMVPARPILDDVAVRRLRQRVLATAGDNRASETARARGLFRRRRALPLVAAACAFAIVGAFSVQPSERAPAALISSLAEGGPSRWFAVTDGRADFVDLEEGTFRVEIRDHAVGGKVIVRTGRRIRADSRG